LQIPVIPLTSDSEGNILYARFEADGDGLKITETSPFKREMLPRIGYRAPLLILDVKGLSRDNINPDILKRFRVRGASMWLMTSVNDADDVFDAFNSDADTVLMPYHRIHSEDDLLDILSVSDSAIPSLFIKEGKCICPDGTEDVLSVADYLFDTGYTRISVIDTDSSLSFEDWKKISQSGDIIPFSRKFHRSVFEYFGMKDVIE
jgi:hypothetical protein